MSSPGIIVVTGASRGVGQGIAQTLLASKTPYTLYLTSTSGENLPSSSNAKHVKLDISNSGDISALASQIEKEHGKESVQVLINNAGINIDNDGYNPDNTKKTLKTNYLGTANMCKAFLPLLKKDGRIVNVASVGGHLKIYSPEVQQKFRHSTKSVADVESLYKEFTSLLDAGKERDSGWAPQAYSISKAFVIAFTSAFAKENPNHLINSCCPGWVDTDMGNLVGDAPKDPMDGAKIPVKLAVGDIGKVSGEFWENQSIRSTDDGDVSTW